MKILDLSAGRRAIWFNKQHPLCTYLDHRAEMEPDIVCDTRNIPGSVGQDFDLVVFDPPHLNMGATSNMGKRYGHYKTTEILDLVYETAIEAHRITKQNGLMALKWNDHDIRLQRVFDLMPQWEPLFGHLTKSGPHSQTFWVLLRRKDNEI